MGVILDGGLARLGEGGEEKYSIIIMFFMNISVCSKVSNEALKS